MPIWRYDIDPSLEWVEETQLRDFDDDDLGWIRLDDDLLVAPTTSIDVPNMLEEFEPKGDLVYVDEDSIPNSGDDFEIGQDDLWWLIMMIIDM